MADEDRAIFDAALSNEPPEPEPVAPQPEVKPEPPAEPTDGVARDDKGRFAPKVDDPAPVAAIPAPDAPVEPRHNVPLTELLNEREKRQKYEGELAEERRGREALQRQIAELRQAQTPAQPTPDMFADPEGYTGHLQQSFDQRLRNTEANFSLRLAHIQYKEEFGDAYNALVREGERGNRQIVQQVMQSSDPGESLIRWRRQSKLMETTGGDLDGYLAKRQEELLNDPQFLAKAADKIRAQASGVTQNGRPSTVTVLPPSLNRATSAASAVSDDDDVSDGALFRQAVRRK